MAKGKPVTRVHPVFGKKTFSYKSWSYLPGSVKKQWKITSTEVATPPEAKPSATKASATKAAGTKSSGTKAKTTKTTKK